MNTMIQQVKQSCGRNFDDEQVRKYVEQTGVYSNSMSVEGETQDVDN